MDTLRFTLGIRFDFLTQPVSKKLMDELLKDLCSAIPLKTARDLMLYAGTYPLSRLDGDSIFTVVFTKGNIRQMRALYALLQNDAHLRGMLCSRLPFVQNNTARRFEGLDYLGKVGDDGLLHEGNDDIGLRFTEKPSARAAYSDKNCIIVAPNSFKGTFSAGEVSAHIREALRKALPNIAVVPIPVADGGDGTLEAAESLLMGSTRTVEVSDPYGRSIKADYFAYNGRSAVIESALACGLALCGDTELDPLKASSKGLGELILRALHEGLTDINIGLGGSATNDCGIGAAAALGFRFLNAECEEITEAGRMAEIVQIDASAADPAIKKAKFTLMCDVENPLTGKNGATYTFGPQKGCNETSLEQLEKGMKNMAVLLDGYCGRAVSSSAGAGAAGGLGAMLMALLNAAYSSGADALMDIAHFDKLLKNASVVITGEGRVDQTSVSGKAVSAVARRAAAAGVPAAILAGSRGGGAESAEKLAVISVYCAEGEDRKAALDEAAEALAEKIKERFYN